MSICAACILLAAPVLGWCGNSGFVESFMLQFEQSAASSASQFHLLTFIALATLISEDLACIAAGLLAAKTIITPAGAVAASAFGIYIGDILLYCAGYLIGISALHHVPLKWFVTEATVRQSKILFERRGAVLILTSRFFPGTRTATFFAAGLVQMRFTRLLLFFALAVVVWAPVLVLGSMIVGKQAVHYVDVYSSYALWGFLGLLLLIFTMTRLLVPLFSWRGRQLLVSRWRRLSRWEFWPYYVTNAVTFFYVLYLGVVRYRQPVLFTNVNPAIKPDGGFVGESKSAILSGLAPDFVGRWQFVAASTSLEDRHKALGHFMSKYALDYPIVLKPDSGQRGQGVGICITSEEATAWLESATQNFIIMEFLDGEEFGVFYYRFPSKSSGVIFSITRKKLLSVTGDGCRTLEELILLDDRALCLAPIFMENLRPDLLTIVPENESILLGRVGSHSLGSLFLDASELKTEKLLQAIEEIVRPYEGFYFGRFDIKVDSEQCLRQGKNLKVIELNGVTSEATHMYDPHHSVFYAWKTLMEQWSIAFQIAEFNRCNGYQPMTLKKFLHHWFMSGR